MESSDELAAALRSSSTSLRTNALRGLHDKIKSTGLGESDSKLLISLLFGTYPLYQDRISRNEVQRCLQTTFEAAPASLGTFVRMLTAESTRTSLAASNVLVLIEWSALVLQYCANHEKEWASFGKGVVKVDAVLLDTLMGMNTRNALSKSAVVITRRAFRAIFKSNQLDSMTLPSSVLELAAKGGIGQKAAVLLGIFAGVAQRLVKAKGDRPSPDSQFLKVKGTYFEFWTREVFGSKTPVARHVAAAFSDFWSHYFTESDLEKEVVPSLEKALLRAPEVVLDVLKEMVTSFPDSLDLSDVLASNLMKPLVTNLKSGNAKIRASALETLIVIVKHSKEKEAVAKEISQPLMASKLTSVEQRTVYAQLVATIVYSDEHSAEICKGLGQVVGKEPNETALAAEAAALVAHLAHLLQKDSESIDFGFSAIAKGLTDKKPTVQKLWAARAGDLIWQLTNDQLQGKTGKRIAESLLPNLLKQYSEIEKNPLPAAQSGAIVSAYVLTALADRLQSILPDTPSSAALKKTQVVKQALAFEPKPSFLLNHKAYSKLASEDDFRWFGRALSGCSNAVVKLEPEAKAAEAWSHGYLYLFCARQVSFKVQREITAQFSSLYASNASAISALAINGLWSWFWAIEDDQKDTAAVAAQTGMSRAHGMVNSLCLPRPNATSDGLATNGDMPSHKLEQQMIDLLVLCQDDIIPRTRWIDLCLQAGQDPGEIAKTKTEICMDHVNGILTKNDQRGTPSDRLRGAGYKTFAELAFVGPESITPRLVEQISQDLSIAELAQYTPTDFAIAQTPDGTTFVDVLSNKTNQLDKAAADYDTQKWERELREQIAAKKGQQRRLTADEQARVKAQLQKEANIRQEVQALKARLLRGTGTVDALAHGPPTEAKIWLGQSLQSLLEIIEAGVGLLLGDAAEMVFIACSNFVTSRLGPVRQFIGVATVRALGSSHIPDNLKEEAVVTLVTRTLYRLRLAGETRPFDVVSLIYMLPLVSTILKRRGVGASSDEEADEQVTLALEFISFHADLFEDQYLPRTQTIQTLIQSMQDYGQHYRLIKDSLNDVCRSISQNSTHNDVAALLRGAIVPQVGVRNAVLQGIRDHIDLTDLDFSEEIWLAAHDDDAENAALADAIWQENALEVEPEDVFKLIPYIDSKDKQLRRATARSLAACVQLDSSQFDVVMDKLQELYLKRNKPLVPQRDKYGIVKKSDLSDPWEARNGVALAFGQLAGVFDVERLQIFLRFLIESGPLGDRSSAVRDEMIACAMTIIAAHGDKKLEQLIGMFEEILNASDKGSEQSDMVNEAVVILYGALARHLESGDKRVPQVVTRLLQTLSTPSETVQYAVAGCLPPLIRTSLDKVSDYVTEVMDQLMNSKSYAVRRGAAYGLAGIVQGKGLSALREMRIITSLRSAAEDKKDSNKRQSAMMAFELLSLILGRTFEPYVIQVVPQLITGFGDANADVREACLDASKTCFSSLSSYGVKIILPTLLGGLDEDQWRSKRGACDLLGAMAYLDPQQLATSLPEIIPPLTNVLNDTHKEVRSAANRSLKRFGEVISNPEIKSLVDILLKALSDPTKYTNDALDALIKVNFVHYLDAPSLALVTRILQRGLGDRSQTKRKAAQIIGSLAHLTEKKDLSSHLPILVAGLRVACVDPVPQTRATASKALGSLMEKLGEDSLPDLIPSLMSTLKADTGAGDRLGSAQALSEVLAGLGTSRLEDTLPTILQNVSSNKASVREGFMSLFIYLPACFGNSFANYLSKIIPPILGGLADDVESIRETALRAGRLIVKNFSTKAIDLLLPELDRGLADDNHRIRLSSVELVGDLLFNLTGITAQQEAEEEDEDTAAEAGQSLLDVLGEEKRNRVLSSLFICRNDTSGLVRSAAINVWKALVASPRTLKELVPSLTQLLIRRLASSNMEHKVIAGNALGELIRKSGEGVLSTLLPTLEEGLQTSTDTDERQGICIALREVISAASPEVLEDYEKTLISVVRAALVDSDREVRETAAEAFDSLQRLFGKRAVDQVLPHLLSLLRDPNQAATALGALLTLLTDNNRSNMILPNLMPTLMTTPISAFNARAIASLSQVAGDAFVRRLPAILNALMDTMIGTKDEELRAELENSFDTVLANVDEYDGLNAAMSTMKTMANHDDHRRRAAADTRLEKFFQNSEVDYSRYHPDLIRVLLLAFDDRDSGVVKAAWAALFELVTKHLKKEEMESLVSSTRQILQHVGVAGSNLPGFSLPKGIGAILPVFTQGLMNGTAEQRTQAALSISDIIDRSSQDALKPYVTGITGPLIRVVSEKSTDLKSAILFTLNNLLQKVPLFLKPFLPQLQRTFAKSLSDPTSDVLRNRAAKALGTLLTLKPRVDPLIAELVTGAKTPDEGVRTAMLKALFEVVAKAGETMSETSRSSILGLIDSDVGEGSGSAVTTNARLLGVLIRVLPPEIAQSLLKQRALATRITPATILSLNAILLEAPQALFEHYPQETPAIICQGIQHKATIVADNAVLAAGKYLIHGGNSIPFEVARPVFEALSSVLPQGNAMDTRRLSLVVLRTIARKHTELVRPHLPLLAPAVFGGVRDITIPVKLASEAAFLSIFSVVDQESAVFDKYIAGADLDAMRKRSMSDYFKRVATRLAGQARERAEAEGGQGGLGLSSDEMEDEREIMSVGRVELADAFANE